MVPYCKVNPHPSGVFMWSLGVQTWQAKQAAPLSNILALTLTDAVPPSSAVPVTNENPELYPALLPAWNINSPYWLNGKAPEASFGNLSPYYM